jgi:hypothetical protein
MIESRFAPAALLVSIVLFSSARADAQTQKPGDPCCAIVPVSDDHHRAFSSAPQVTQVTVAVAPGGG